MKVELQDVAYITETSVTIRGSRRRTTVPKALADRLELKDGDKIRWIMMTDGTVLISSVPDQ